MYRALAGEHEGAGWLYSVFWTGTYGRRVGTIDAERADGVLGSHAYATRRQISSDVSPSEPFSQVRLGIHRPQLDQVRHS